MLQEVSLYVPGETYTSARATPELVGREKELEQIEGAIRDTEHSYMIYITGQGGIGKTRLVKNVLEHPPDGIPLVMASELIDLYHTRVHSLAGFIGAILDVLKPLVEHFREALEETGADKLEEVARAEQEGLTLAEVVSRRKELTGLFINAFNRLSSQRRVVLALDTAERIQVTDPTQEPLGLSQERPFILNWLLEDFLPNVNDVVVLLARRPGPARLEQLLEQIESKEFRLIELQGLTEEEVVRYFEAMANEAAATDDPATADAIAELEEEDILTIFYSLCDEQAGSMTVRPILLALAIDYLVMEGRPLPALSRPMEEAKKLRPEQRSGIRDQLGRQLVRTIRDNRRPADEAIVALAWLPKGADAEFLARVAELSEAEVQDALDKLRDLSFVKIRPDDSRVFLHDEMYDLLRSHALEPVPPPRRQAVFEAIAEYYDQQIDAAREEIAGLYAMPGEAIWPEPGKVIAARARLQDALVEDLYYSLWHDPATGFQKYFRYAEEAIAAYDESLDMQLRAELFGFLTERDPSGKAEEVDGLRQIDVMADAAVRWIKRLLARGQHQRGLDLAHRLRQKAIGLVARGGALAEAELNTWEALALAEQGQYNEAEQLLCSAISILEKVPRSVRWAGILARAYNNLGYVHRLQGRHYGAISAYEKALPLWRATKIEDEQANTLNNRAFALAEVGVFDAAWQQAWDGLELRKRLGPRIPVGLSLNTLAHVKIRENDLEGAQPYAEGALELFTTLNSARGRGLALTALAEVERRISDWEPYLPDRTANWLSEAAKHAEEAERIFREEVYEPARLVEALIEVGCAYRDWAEIRRDYPDVLAEEEMKPDMGVYTVEKLAEASERALREAAQLADLHDIHYRQVDALVNLGWLRYYTELHTKVHPDDFDKAKRSLEGEVIAQVEQIIPDTYRITLRRITPLVETRGGLPTLERERVIVPFLVQLGKLELLRGQIAFNRFIQSGNQDVDALSEAVEHYTLSLAYDTLFSDQVFRDMRRGMERIYERLKILNVQELLTVYETVADVEKKYGLGKSRMSQFLQDRFGPHELLVPIEL